MVYSLPYISSLLFISTNLISSTASAPNLLNAAHEKLAARAPTTIPAILAPTAAIATPIVILGTQTVAPVAAAPTVAAGPVLPAGLSLIGTATTVEVTQTLPSTYAAGATPPVRGAPLLPSIVNINPADYPALDRQPPTNSPQVLQWISQINLAGAPNIPITGINGCANTTFNAVQIAAASSAGNCWWTCGGCTRATDLSFCPQKNTWGLSYDDGPSPYTPRLLNLLSLRNIKATFFIVGSRAISRPQMIQTEYMQGHQLSVHTWAHPYLTQMTNEQIVAELGWTKKIIKDITGVTPNTMRPPYGDIDDRVRYISLQMGLTPIIWTSYSGNTFDTRDWQIGAGVVNATSVYTNFETYLGLAVTTLKTGFVVLAHDLYQQSVELAVTYILPEVLSAGVLTLQPIITCLGFNLADAYAETANATLPATETSVTLVGASGTGFVALVAQTSYTPPPAATTVIITAANGQVVTSASTPSASTSSRGSAAGRINVGIESWFMVLGGLVGGVGMIW